LGEDFLRRELWPAGGSSSSSRPWSFTFKDEDISAQDKIDAQAALPDGIRLLYSFSREEISDEE